ncbi:hypothetical protein AB4407_15475 [Vibrio sp. 10N.261.46.E11]|uniref:hypothetical protein n=1 Tax=Vibrio sp. 10N.261.46.E11 TaxID=3229662 RepID=UPI003551205E
MKLSFPILGLIALSLFTTNSLAKSTNNIKVIYCNDCYSQQDYTEAAHSALKIPTIAIVNPNSLSLELFKANIYELSSSKSEVQSSSFSTYLAPPERPETFNSPEELRAYLKALNEYYAIVGRP